MIRAFVLGACIAALAGCASAPPPAPAPVVIRLKPPAALTESEPAPDVPGQKATQKTVARYLIQLHSWGQDGWDRVQSIRDWGKTAGGTR